MPFATLGNAVLGTVSGRELVKDSLRRETCPVSQGFVSLRVSSLEENRELVIGERALPRPPPPGQKKQPSTFRPTTNPGTDTCEGHNPVSAADAPWQSPSCSPARGKEDWA